MDRYELTRFYADIQRDEGFKRYAAYTSHMDHCLGQLIEALKVTDQYHNTVIVLTSGNGAIPAEVQDVFLYPGWPQETLLMGSNLPFRGRKGQLYEGGIRTPTVVRWHGVLPAGTQMNAPLHMVDWMPTLAALAGVAPSDDFRWDGMDIGPLLYETAKEPPDRILYWNLQHQRFAVRRGSWKLIARYDESGRQTELYNIANDPGETSDLAGHQPKRVDDMLDMIADARKGDDTSVRPDRS